MDGEHKRRSVRRLKGTMSYVSPSQGGSGSANSSSSTSTAVVEQQKIILKVEPAMVKEIVQALSLLRCEIQNLSLKPVNLKVNVNLPDMEPPSVTIQPAKITVEAPQIYPDFKPDIHIKEQGVGWYDYAGFAMMALSSFLLFLLLYRIW